MLRNVRYAKTLRQRLGFLPSALCRDTSGSIWIHAVSVGEVIAAGTLIRELRTTSQAAVFVSTTTLAGYAAARERLRDQAAGCFYAPIDYVPVIRRVLRAIKPSAVVVLETEIWPNLFREVKRAGCGLMIANGRISDRAFPAYRSRKWFFSSVLRWPDRILVQDELMRQRYVAAGAPEDRVAVSGNLKYDFEARTPEPDSPVVRWLRAGTGPVLIAASTTADEEVDEDRAALEAFGGLDGWRLILAPRKPERFDRVAEMLEAGSFWRRAAGSFTGDERVLLLDTIGELASLFSLADVVFMGGTLTRTGGHNFLEPAFAAKPVVVGPHLENFKEMADDFRRHRAFIEISGPGELRAGVVRAVANSWIGLHAKQRAEANRGAVQITAREVRRLYAESVFLGVRTLPARILLTPLALIWEAGSRRRLARDLQRQRRLDTPVISIGNITLGGTGKTPVVLHLARRFLERGTEPVVLTRGYGRISHRDRLVLKRGQKADVWHTGDEPQILLRSGQCGLGVASDRYLVGLEAEAALHPGVFLLDDGFSHQRLARDVEVVLIDALDPFGSGEAVPLGRLREPLESLRRADIFMITRCTPTRPLQAIENKLRRLNERAPIFRSRLIAREWISMETGQPCRPPYSVVAFCGLGNPDSFWLSIEELGVHPIDRLCYDDHHHYAPVELRRLVKHANAVRAGALLTTEKDIVNLPEDSANIFGDMPVFWLRVEVEIEDEAELLRLLNPDDIRARQASDRRLAPAHP